MNSTAVVAIVRASAKVGLPCTALLVSFDNCFFAENFGSGGAIRSIPRFLGADATELRRLLAEVEADAKALKARQDELEAHLAAAPAESWLEAAEKARYLLRLFAATPEARDPRKQELIMNALEHFRRWGFLIKKPPC